MALAAGALVSLCDALPLTLPLAGARDCAITFGRSTESAVCLPDKAISRKHAELVSRGGALYLRSFNAANAPTVNGAPLSVEEGERLLAAGDTIAFVGNERVWEFKVDVDEDVTGAPARARGGAPPPAGRARCISTTHISERAPRLSRASPRPHPAPRAQALVSAGREGGPSAAAVHRLFAAVFAARVRAHLAASRAVCPLHRTRSSPLACSPQAVTWVALLLFALLPRARAVYLRRGDVALALYAFLNTAVWPVVIEIALRHQPAAVMPRRFAVASALVNLLVRASGGAACVRAWHLSRRGGRCCCGAQLGGAWLTPYVRLRALLPTLLLRGLLPAVGACARAHCSAPRSPVTAAAGARSVGVQRAGVLPLR